MEGLAATFISVDETYEQRSFPNASMQLLNNLECFRNKARFENKILGWISRYREFLQTSMESKWWSGVPTTAITGSALGLHRLLRK